MKQLIIFLLFTFLFALRVNAQIDSISRDSLIDYELQLTGLGYEILNGPDDQTKATSTRQFIRTFVRALRVKGSWDYPFDSLKSISILKPADNSFRIFTWNLPTSKGKYLYFGAIQMNSRDLKFFPLFDASDHIQHITDTVTDNNVWYGAHYYKLIENKYKKKSFYTLLGWDGNDRSSNKRVIEVLTFADGKPVFGAPIFKLGNEVLQSRMVFEHSEEANMVLRYHDKRKVIFYENLIPPKTSATGIFSTYLPDGSFDYLEFKKGFWVKGVKPVESLKLEE
jgi:hypothetical protein